MEINPTLFCTLPIAIIMALLVIAACMRSAQISEQERQQGRDD